MSARSWWRGVVAFVVLVGLLGAASALSSRYFQPVVLGVALLVGLGGTAVSAFVAHRRPAARAVAVGLVWTAPVCATTTSTALLRS